MRALGLLVLLVPSVALAQPGAPQPAPPPPTQPPQPYPPQSYPPQPGYGQPVYPQPAAPSTLHTGVTFEANLGFGFVHVSGNGASDDSDLSLGGLDLGVGGWMNPKVALTARLAGVTLSQSSIRETFAFLGPSIQYWTDDHFWFGGGAGLSFIYFTSSAVSGSDHLTGFGLDLRAGYSFATTTANTVNLSLELTPGYYSESGGSATGTGIAFLVGYQYL